jgi:hypothetical protein
MGRLSGRWRALLGLCLVLGLLLAVPRLLRMRRLRAAGRSAIYAEAADWLLDHSLATDRIAVPEAALARFDGLATLGIPERVDAAALLTLLQTERPDYCVALKSIAWDGVRARSWFQARYRPVYSDRDAHDAATPVTLFVYRPTPFDRGETVPVDRGFSDGGDVRAALASVRVSRTRIVPGEPLYVTLRWAPLRPEALPVAVSLFLRGPDDGARWAQTTGDLTQPHYVLLPPDDAPEGRYTLDVALTLPGGQPLEPEGDGGGSVGALVTLATLRHPPDVSEGPLDPDHPLQADFGPRIALVGYDAPAWVTPDEPLRVALYWYARQTPVADYKVFVHVLDEAGDLLAQSDGKPVYWFYPTAAWQAGETIRDVHVLDLDPSLPRSNVRIAIGMYRTSDGERLPITGAPEGRVANRRLQLHLLRVR